VLTLFADLTPAGAVCLGVSAAGLVAIPALLFADAELADFDPRHALRRALESPAADRVLIELTNARYAPRDAAITVAALLMLLTVSPEATR
jgi:hypothetical protein